MPEGLGSRIIVAACIIWLLLVSHYGAFAFGHFWGHRTVGDLCRYIRDKFRP